MILGDNINKKSLYYALLKTRVQTIQLKKDMANLTHLISSATMLTNLINSYILAVEDGVNYVGVYTTLRTNIRNALNLIDIMPTNENIAGVLREHLIPIIRAGLQSLRIDCNTILFANEGDVDNNGAVPEPELVIIANNIITIIRQFERDNPVLFPNHEMVRAMSVCSGVGESPPLGSPSPPLN